MYAVVGQFGFRQLTLYWRMRSLSKKNTGWGTMTRVGHGGAKPKPAAAPAPAAPSPNAAVVSPVTQATSNDMPASPAPELVGASTQ
jgi:hypothetical protein